MELRFKDNPFGQMISVSGLEIVIEINKNLMDGNLEQEIITGDLLEKYNVGIVGDIFAIGGPTTSHKIHFAMFEEIKLVSEIEDENLQLNNLDRNKKAVAIGKIIGYQDSSNTQELCFKRGSGHYPRFNSKCYLLTSEEKRKMFFIDEEKGLNIGHVTGSEEENITLITDKFLGKHSVILGSTGSGKSSTVASILQKILLKYSHSHMVFFDLHNEYTEAFNNERFENRVNTFSGENFALPYWFLNFEEFLSVFLGEIDFSSNEYGIRILKEQIIELKKKEHSMIEEIVGDISKVDINAPLFFDFEELVQSLDWLNRKTLWKSDRTLATNPETKDFYPNTGNTATYLKPDENKNVAVIQDPNYYGKFNQIIDKLISIKDDKRYQFLFNSSYGNSQTLYGYLLDLLTINSEDKQLSIINLSKIPSEISPVIIGVLARICFEYKLWESNPEQLPIYLVFEEAHNYIPNEDNKITRLPKKYIGRIAKEGRKYGLSQLIISQRPSDLSSSIVSQCSNFFVLRVTNPNDQTFIRNILPDHLATLTDMIPMFQNGEVLITGECVPLPIKGLIDMPNPSPKSSDVSFTSAWSIPLEEYDIKNTVHKWWDINE